MTLTNPIDELIERLDARAKRQADRGMSGLGYYGPGDASLDTQTSAALSTLQEQKRKLEEALKPFARIPVLSPDAEDRDLVLYKNGGASITVGDLRRARALLSGGGE
jgi:hypothetical protein